MHVCALNGGSVFVRFMINVYMKLDQLEATLLKSRGWFGRLYLC